MKYTYLSTPVNTEEINEINYSQANVGNNPSINLATGRLQYMFHDAESGAGNFSINVAHIYNSKLNDKFTAKLINLGKKWKLNLTQCIILDNYDSATGKSIIKYMDESGEIHRFISFDTNKWHNDCDSKTTIEKVGQEYILSDGVGNKLYFNTKGYLSKSVSCQNASIVKVYKYDALNRLVSVYDQRTLKNNVVQNRVDLFYDGSKNLKQIITYNKGSRPGVGCRYEYDDSDNLTAVYSLAFGSSGQKVAEKQILQLHYENDNLSLIIDSESKSANLIQYEEGRVSKLSKGFIQENVLSCGMTDSANNKLAVSNNLRSGTSCEPTFVEKSYNTFEYIYGFVGDNIASEVDITNECNITLRYFIDRKARITSSFELDNSFGKDGVNLKTLTKYEGQIAPSATTSALGYINGCGTFLASSGKFTKTVSAPIRFVDGVPIHTSVTVNYLFWLKIKKPYKVLEAKAVLKESFSTNDKSSTGKVLLNPYAVGVWQHVAIPLSMPENSNPDSYYSIDVSFLSDKNNQSTDDFEINEIGLSSAPVEEMHFWTSGSTTLPLSLVQKVKLIRGSTSEIVNVDRDFYLTEADVIATFTNKYKSSTGTFDFICNNGTDRRANLTNIQFYSATLGWVGYEGNNPFYIHTNLTIKDSYVKTYYIYENDGFSILNEYSKTIDNSDYESSASMKIDYKGKTLYKQDEYGTTENYQYDSFGNIKIVSVVNGTDTLSKQTFEYDTEGRLISVDDGINKQKITYNDENQPKKVEKLENESNVMKETGHYISNSIGIFKDKNVTVSEFNSAEKVGTKHLTYENGNIRTISDGLVKYGVQYNSFNDSVTYTQFNGNEEKPIQMDAISQYFRNGDKYVKTHTSNFYNNAGKVTHKSSVDIDSYGKAVKMKIGAVESDGRWSQGASDEFNYLYQSVQESEFTAKPTLCMNAERNSSTQFRYDDNSNLMGWKEVENQETVFEVQQTAPNTTKYIYNDDDVEYFVQINRDKNKLASPRVESVAVLSDYRENIDKPSELFKVNYKWKPNGNPDEISTKLSTEKYSYSRLKNNLLLQKVQYDSNKKINANTFEVKFSDELQYFDNGLLKQEVVKHQKFEKTIGSIINPTYDPVISTRTFQYDNLHRITKEFNSGLNVNRTYSYYPDGRLKSIIGKDNSDARRFTYDEKGQLSRVNNDTTFAYDHFGNRISKTVNGVVTPYTFDVGGRLVSAGGVKYTYNADGIRCKKTCIANGITERMYLDGGKILGEDRANCKLRYFYDLTGLKQIRKIENGFAKDYECVKDSQGSIVMLVNIQSGKVSCRYEYDALGNCTVLEDDGDVAQLNPFRWKGFFFDSETGFYYANGSYYDPETGLYVDAAPVSAVLENSDSPKHIDRCGTLCYNALEIEGSPYTAATTVTLSEDPSYDPGKTWWEKLCDWWRGKPTWLKVLAGVVLIVASIVIAVSTAGASLGLEAELLGSTVAVTTAAKAVLIDLSIGIGLAATNWAINSLSSGNWNTGELTNTIADAVFFAGLFLFVQTGISAIKYVYRSEPVVIDGVEVQLAKGQDFTQEAWDRINSLPKNADGSTRSTLADGWFIHKGYKGGRYKEYFRKGVGRFDFYDEANKIIYELKPNNPSSIARGIKQLKRYNKALGGGYKLVLVLY